MDWRPGGLNPKAWWATAPARATGIFLFGPMCNGIQLSMFVKYACNILEPSDYFMYHQV